MPSNFPLLLSPLSSLATHIFETFLATTKHSLLREVNWVDMYVGANNNPRTVEEVFKDFMGRRNGLIKALTTGNLFILYFLCQILSFSVVLSIELYLDFFLSSRVSVWTLVHFVLLKLGFVCFPLFQMLKSFFNVAIPVSCGVLFCVLGFGWMCWLFYYSLDKLWAFFQACGDGGISFTLLIQQYNTRIYCKR